MQGQKIPLPHHRLEGGWKACRVIKRNLQGGVVIVLRENSWCTDIMAGIVKYSFRHMKFCMAELEIQNLFKNVLMGSRVAF